MNWTITILTPTASKTLKILIPLQTFSLIDAELFALFPIENRWVVRVEKQKKKCCLL